MLSAAQDRPALLVATYFGDLGPTLPVIAGTGVEGLAIDLVAGAVPDDGILAGKHVVAGVVDGRNVWRTDLGRALDLLERVERMASSVAVSTSCSLLHVPYTLAGEDALDEGLLPWLAFGAEKAAEVALLARARQEDSNPVAEFASAAAAVEARRADPRLHRDEVRERLAGLTEADRRRPDANVRRGRQDELLGLPALPTTTIGSYPQTPRIR